MNALQAVDRGAITSRAFRPPRRRRLQHLGAEGAAHAAAMRSSIVVAREMLERALRICDGGIALLDGISPPKA
jgi:hypothetical protein